jgi:hypothetical protein
LIQSAPGALDLSAGSDGFITHKIPEIIPIDDVACAIVLLEENGWISRCCKKNHDCAVTAKGFQQKV